MRLRRRRRRRELQTATAAVDSTASGPVTDEAAGDRNEDCAPSGPQPSGTARLPIAMRTDRRRWLRARFGHLTRNQWLVAGAVALTLFLVIAISFGPAVRAIAVARANAAGVSLDIEGVRPGLGIVRLRGVTVTVPEAPAVRARLDCIEINPTWLFGLEEVDVHGGRVTLQGSLEELKRQLGNLRKDRAPKRAGAASEVTPIRVDGIDVVWKEPNGGTHRVWGARYERTPAGEERIFADLTRLSRHRSGIEVEGAALSLGRDHGRRVLSSLAALRVVADVDLDELPLLGGLLPAPPDTTSAAQVRGAANAGTGFRGKRLRAALSRFAGEAHDLLVPGAAIDISGIRARLRHGSQLLNVGPGALSLSRDDGHVRVRLTPGATREAPLTLALDVPFGEGPVVMDLDGGPVSLAALGVQEGDMGLVQVSESYLEGRGRAKLAADGQSLEFSGRSRITGLSLQDRRLAADRVRGLQIGASGQGSLAVDGSRIDLEETELSFGKVRVEISGHIERGDGDAAGRLQVKVPLASCQDMFDSVPEGLVPMLGGMRWSGTFALDGKMKFDTKRAADMDVDWRVANECRITDVPEAIHPARFQRPWMRNVEGPGGEVLAIESGPGTPDWVSYFDISRHMETALVVCEDAHFWAHDGFDHEAIRDSIRDNVLAGRFVRGASTLSMQLAKNLYLGREKTLSRKFQEAVLTMLLEQELSKEQILELYLNVVEFGPGIFGIGQAAQYYFHSRARDLSLGQSLYLASILPNPNQRHFGSDGLLSDRWTAYLHKLMMIAHKIRRVSDEELEQGLTEVLSFGEPSVPQVGDGEETIPDAPSLELSP